MSGVLLKILLLINGLIEGGFGIYLIVFPEEMSRALGCPQLVHVSYTLVSRMYGLGALCLGILSLDQFLRRGKSDSLTVCLLIFTIFHVGMAIIQLVDNPNIQASLVHIVLGSAFLFSYLKRLGGQTNP